MHHAHFTAGARGFERLVRDDLDRRDLLDLLRGAVGGALLAWCLMDTHLHAVVEGATAARPGLTAALTAYARRRNRRHGGRGGALRGPPVAIAIPGPFELARTIRYVHENPVSARLVERSSDWPWSSAQAYAGLVSVGAEAVARARRAIDPRALRLLEPQATLASADPRATPEAAPRALLHAAAHVLSLDPAAIAGSGRDAAAVAGRALFVRLGLLEGYRHGQLAPLLGVTRQRVTQHAAAGVDELDVRRARTLLRDGLVAIPPLATSAPSGGVPACLPRRQIHGPLDFERRADLPGRQARGGASCPAAAPS